MVQLVRHRQTKGAATDRLDLRPPRHILTLPFFTVQREIQNITPSRSEIGMTLVIPEASHSGGSTSGCCHLWRLQFRLFRKSQRVIDLDPEVAHRAFELSMPEQKLHCPQIPRQFIDQGRFGPPK